MVVRLDMDKDKARADVTEDEEGLDTTFASFDMEKWNPEASLTGHSFEARVPRPFRASTKFAEYQDICKDITDFIIKEAIILARCTDDEFREMLDGLQYGSFETAHFDVTEGHPAASDDIYLLSKSMGDLDGYLPFALLGIESAFLAFHSKIGSFSKNLTKMVQSITLDEQLDFADSYITVKLSRQGGNANEQ